MRWSAGRPESGQRRRSGRRLRSRHGVCGASSPNIRSVRSTEVGDSPASPDGEQSQAENVTIVNNWAHPLGRPAFHDGERAGADQGSKSRVRAWAHHRWRLAAEHVTQDHVPPITVMGRENRRAPHAVIEGGAGAQGRRTGPWRRIQHQQHLAGVKPAKNPRRGETRCQPGSAGRSGRRGALLSRTSRARPPEPPAIASPRTPMTSKPRRAACEAPATPPTRTAAYALHGGGPPAVDDVHGCHRYGVARERATLHRGSRLVARAPAEPAGDTDVPAASSHQPTLPMGAGRCRPVCQGPSPGWMPGSGPTHVRGDPDLPCVPELPPADQARIWSAALICCPRWPRSSPARTPSGWRLAGRTSGAAAICAGRRLAGGRPRRRRGGVLGSFHGQVGAGRSAGRWPQTWSWPTAAACSATRGRCGISASAYETAVDSQMVRLTRRFAGAGLVLQIDEPSLPGWLPVGSRPSAGWTTTARFSGRRTPRPRVVSAAQARSALVVLHCCAIPAPIGMLRQTGADAVDVDLTAQSAAGNAGRDEHEVGELFGSTLGWLPGARWAPSCRVRGDRGSWARDRAGVWRRG